MPLYTRTGDFGETSLFGGKRVLKNSQRVCAYGTLDEACAAIGVARTLCLETEVNACLRTVHHKLMLCGTTLANPDYFADAASCILPEDIAELEGFCESLMKSIGTLKGFIIISQSTGAAQINTARTVVRRLEREVVALGLNCISPHVYAYINRASDALFAAACCEEFNTAGSLEYLETSREQ